MSKLTEAVFSMQCSFIAKNAAAWAGDLLTLQEHYHKEADHKTVARFTDEMRERLDRLDKWAGRPMSKEHTPPAQATQIHLLERVLAYLEGGDPKATSGGERNSDLRDAVRKVLEASK